MTKDLLIGIDAGTSVIKAIAFNTAGQQVGIASRRNSYTSLPNGGVEQDMARTWSDTAAVLRDLAEAIPDLASRALGLGVTGQGDGTWLIDADGEPVHDGWLWLDARAKAEAREIAACDGIDTIYEATGTGINVCQSRTHLTWMKRHEPELLSRATTAFHCKDWLYFKLTGQRATDPSEALFTFGDIATRTYSVDAIAALDLTDHRSLLPPIIDGSSHAEGLSAKAAQATGLPEGLPICLGYVDVMCCAMAAGLLDAAVAPGLTVLGSTGIHMRYAANAESVQLNPERSGYTMALPGGAYAQLQSNMAATLNIDWMLGLGAELLASEGVERDPVDLLNGLDARVLAARPGGALYHPYISSAGERGPFTEPDARASFTGLDQNTGWFDMMRGIFDGLGLAARDCYAAMGPTPAEIRLTGGAARSTAARKIIASALNAPVRTITQDEAGAAGAVMIAAVQLGLFANIDDCAAAWVTPLLEDTIEPDAELIETYDHLFEGYLGTRQALVPAWTVQAAMREALT